MPKKEFKSRKIKLGVILQTLQQGEYKSTSGQATNDLYQAACSNGLADCTDVAFRDMLKALEDKGLIVREIRGRRCYEIVFVDGGDYLELAPPTTAPTQQEQLELAPPEPATNGAIDYDILAVSLLEQVVEILLRPAEFETNQQALHEAREQSQKYKRLFNDEQSENSLLQRRNRELTVELSQVKDNLARVMRDKGKAISHETQRALDRVMRERPSTK